MDFEFTAAIWYWRGPAPHYFVTVPLPESGDIKAMSSSVTYGWGMIPVHVQIGDTRWRTSLYEKNGQYIVPLKLAVRKALDLTEGDTVTVRLSIAVG